MKKSNFQTVIFAKVFVTVNGHTSKLFKIIFYDGQTDGKGEINTAEYNYMYSKNCFFRTNSIE